jgi:hypothetical protein
MTPRHPRTADPCLFRTPPGTTPCPRCAIPRPDHHLAGRPPPARPPNRREADGRLNEPARPGVGRRTRWINQIGNVVRHHYPASQTSADLQLGQGAGRSHPRDYIGRWNANPRPFVWTATTDEILAKVRVVQSNTRKLVDNNGKLIRQDDVTLGRARLSAEFGRSGGGHSSVTSMWGC